MAESIVDARNGFSYSLELLDNGMAALFVGDTGGEVLPAPWAKLGDGNAYICACKMSSVLSVIEAMDNAT